MWKTLCIGVIVAIPALVLAQDDIVGILDQRLEQEWQECAYTRVVKMCDSIDRTQILDHPAIKAYTLYWRGLALYELRQVGQARQLLSESRDLFRKSGGAYTDLWARSSLALASLEYDQSGYFEARPIVEEVLDEIRIGWNYRVSALARLMFICGEVSKQSEADSLWIVAESILHQRGDSTSSAAAGLYYVRALHQNRKSDYEGAARFAQKNYDLVVANNAGRTERMKATAGLASSYSVLRKFDKAIQLNEQALNESRCPGLSSDRIAAVICMNIGNSYVLRKEFTYAEAYFLESIRLFNAAIAGPHHWKVQVGSKLADLYARQNDVIKTQEIVAQVFDMAEALGILTPATEYELKFCLQRVEPDPHKALDLVTQAYRTANTAFGIRDYRTVSTAMSVASAYGRVGDYKNALRYQRKVDSLMTAIGGHPQIPEIYEDLTEASLRQQDITAAQGFLDTSINRLSAQSQISADIYQGMLAGPELFYLSGKVASKRWEEFQDTTALLQAHENFVQAIQAVEFAMTATSIPQDQSAFINILRQYYQMAIDHAMLLREVYGTNWDEEIFSLAERSRNIVLRSHLSSIGATRSTQVSDSVKQALGRCMTQILVLQNRMHRTDSTAVRNELNAQLASLKNRYNALKFEVEAKNRQTKEVAYDTSPSINEVTNRLVTGRGLMAYFTAGQRLNVFVFTQDTFRLIDLGPIEPVLEKIALQRNLITGFPSTHDKTANLEQYKQVGHKLFKLLLEPVIKSAPEVLMWTIVPDRELNYISFESLVDHEGDYLIESDLTFSYALSSLSHIKNTRRTSARHVGVYLPDYRHTLTQRSDTVKSEVRAMLERSGGLELPESDFAMAGIKAGFNVDLFDGERASKSGFLSTAMQYATLHLSMHGIREEGNPMLSYLLFQQQAGQEPDADKLFLGEIYTLSLPAELVFLAACQTASGPMNDGEGILSFSRAFTYAGAAATITGLWNLPHQATATVSGAFYENLAAGYNKAEALKRARLTYLNHQIEPTLKHPYYWAGLILQGEIESIDVQEKPKGRRLIGLLLLAISLLIILWQPWRSA